MVCLHLHVASHTWEINSFKQTFVCLVWFGVVQDAQMASSSEGFFSRGKNKLVGGFLSLFIMAQQRLPSAFHLIVPDPISFSDPSPNCARK